jgi:alkanesulfonate monooxygenase SsuD/methylene tetrahydromethanopterin reductase-like flavin-dependent oxidoreductase (luciferase family)
LEQAVAVYRSEFRPSEQLERPHVIAAVNVIAADTEADAQEQLARAKRARLRALARPGVSLSDEQADEVLASAQGAQIQHMVRYSAVGRPHQVRAYLDEFEQHADADELIVAFQSPTVEQRLRSAELLAGVSSLVAS